MKQSLRLGRLAGVPVGVHWSVVVIVALIAWILGGDVLPAMAPGGAPAEYWAVAIPGALLFVVALLAHELAHAFVARRKGVPVRSITLWALGGVAELGGDSPSASADLQIAAAGPATSLAAGVVFAGVAVAIGWFGGPLIAVAGLWWLAVMNGLIAVFNLLPGAPLDGGRILRAALWQRHGDRLRAARAAAGAGRVLGALMVGAGVAELLLLRSFGGLWLMLIGIFVASAATAEASAETANAALGGLRVRDVMTPDPAVGPAWARVSEFIDRVALQSAQTVYPVVGFDGALVGAVSLDVISRVPPSARAGTSLQQVAVRVPPSHIAAPGDPAGPLHARTPVAGELHAVVEDEGRIVGLVTAQDLREAVRRSRLRDRPLHETRA